jgi:hypothetical protein
VVAERVDFEVKQLLQVLAGLMHVLRKQLQGQFKMGQRVQRLIEGSMPSPSRRVIA